MTAFIAALLVAVPFISLPANDENDEIQTVEELSYEKRADVEQAVKDYIEEKKERTPSVAISVFEGDKDICTVIWGEADMNTQRLISCFRLRGNLPTERQEYATVFSILR